MTTVYGSFDPPLGQSEARGVIVFTPKVEIDTDEGFVPRVARGVRLIGGEFSTNVVPGPYWIETRIVGSKDWAKKRSVVVPDQESIEVDELLGGSTNWEPQVVGAAQQARDAAIAAKNAAEEILGEVEAGVVPDSAVASKITDPATATRAAIDARITALGDTTYAAKTIESTIADKYTKPSGGIPLADLKVSDLDSSYAPKWKASTTYAENALVMLPAPLNILGTRNSSGTSRGTFDTTEQGLWTATAASASQGAKADAAVPQGRLAYSPLDQGAAGDGTTNDYAALAAAIAAATAGSVLDLGGRTFNVGQTVTFGKTLTVRNGSIIRNGGRVAIVTAANVRMENVTFTRTGSTRDANSGALVWNAASGTLVDVRATSTVGEGLRLGNGACNGTRIIRGYFESSDTYESYGIHLVSGGSHNFDVSVEGATVRNSGYGTGIGFYNCSRCTVRGCDVRSIRRSPVVTLTGWTVSSGNVYRTLDRVDTESNAVYVNGTEYRKFSNASSATPDQGYYTVPGDGYIYINTGVNPDTQTVTATRTNGYGVLMYATTSEALGMKDNLIAHNYVEDTDGFGIYYQTLQNVPKNNRTLQNTLRNTCLTGVTVADLPFAAIGVFGGQDVTIEGDLIDGVGASGTPAPGVEFKASVGTPSVSAQVRGVNIRNATGNGLVLSPGVYKLEAVSAIGNGGHGITNGTIQNGEVLDVMAVNCVVTGNTGNGTYFETTTTGEIRVNITGGIYANNVRNISVSRCRDVFIGGGVLSYGSSNIGVSLTGTNQRVVIDGLKLRSGVGLNVASGIADLFVGTITHDGSSGTKVAITGPYRTAGAVGGVGQWVCSGTPEGVVTAPIGSFCRRTDGGAGTSLYVKESGTGNTGWVAK